MLCVCVCVCVCVCARGLYTVGVTSSEDRFGTNSSPVSLLLSPFHDGTDQVQILHLVVAWGHDSWFC